MNCIWVLQNFATSCEIMSSLEVTSLEEVEISGGFIFARPTDRLSLNLGHYFLSCHASPPPSAVVHQ